MKKYSIRIPSEYQELAELANSGTQYIDTGLLGSDMNGCELELVMRNDLNGTNAYNFNGSYLVGSSAQFGLVATSNTLCRASMNFGFTEAISTPDLTNHQYHTLYVKSGLQKVDDTTVGTLSFGTLNENPFLLFGRTQSEGGVNIGSGMSLKSFTVKRNGEYIRNMIPVRRISDSVLGLYDMTNDVFYTNQGTDDFIAGTNVNNYIWKTKNPPRYGIATDIITELPQEIITDGQPIGANLFDATGANVGYYIDSYGQLAGGTSAAGWTASDYIEIDENSQYTFTPNSTAGNSAKHCFYNENKSAFISAIINSGQQTFITPVGAKYARFSYRDSSTNIMLNTGQTDLPYQPYAPTIIKGNMVQNGAPSPSSPITPSETGDRTENLFDKSTMQVNAYLVSTDGTYQPSSGNSYSCLVKVKPNTSYRVRAISKTYRIAFFTHEPQVGSIPTTFYSSDHDAYSAIAVIRTSGSEDRYMMLFCYNAAIEYTDGKTVDEIMSTVMISEGTEMAVPYQPYGYVLPIETGSTTTPVYLGQIQSTRRIKKYEFTGQESWTKNNSSNPNEYLYYANRANMLPNSIVKTPLLCNELPVRNGAPQVNIGINTDNTFNVVYANFGGDVMNAQPSGNTVAGLKEYLASQYANGTPVCVWYVLATETIGILNEPLRKIRDYSDSVSVTGIPTTLGSQQFDVDTSLKPSEVDLTYHGWHDATVKEWDGSEWQ